MKLRNRVQAAGGAVTPGLAADDAGPLDAALQLAAVEADHVHVEEAAKVLVVLLDPDAEGLDLLRRGVKGEVTLVPGGQIAGELLQDLHFVLKEAQPELIHPPEEGAVGQIRDLDRPGDIHGEGDHRRLVFRQQSVLNGHPFFPGSEYFGECDFLFGHIGFILL